MPRAELTVTLPDSTWIHGASTSFPDLTFRVLAALTGEESGIGLLELRVDDPLPVIEDVRGRADVVDLELLWKHGARALLQIEIDDPLVLSPAWRAGVPPRMPFEIRDGEATWELTTSTDRLSSLGDHLTDAGIQFRIEYVRAIDEGEADRIVTDRQRELLLAAVARGYYASPRESTLTEIADELGISKSTCSDVLHRAEGNVLHWFVDEYLSADVPA